MLIRIRGPATRIDDWTHKLDLNIPVYFLDSESYNICLRKICITLENLNTFPITQFWSLQTTLIDKTSLNPKQELASFLRKYSQVVKNGSYISNLYYEPFIRVDYKIQQTELHSAEFILSSQRPDNKTDVSFVELLLEITEHARFQ